MDYSKFRQVPVCEQSNLIPAVLVGGTLASLEIVQRSEEAMAIIPVITDCGLLLFLALRMGMLVKCKRKVGT